MEDVIAPPQVGTRIKEIRAWRDVSLRAVAELAGVSPGFLSMVENGERMVQQRKHLEAIARALRISPTELGALPTTGVLDPDVSRALDGLVDVEAALTDVQLGSRPSPPGRGTPCAATLSACKPFCVPAPTSPRRCRCCRRSSAS